MGRQAKVWITENMNNSKVAQSRAYGHTFHCLKIHVQKQLIDKNFQSSAFLFVVQCMYLEIISVQDFASKHFISCEQHDHRNVWPSLAATLLRLAYPLNVLE